MNVGMLMALSGALSVPTRRAERSDRGYWRTQEEAEAHKKKREERKKERQRKKKARKERR
jgi:hypothetical protein